MKIREFYKTLHLLYWRCHNFVIALRSLPRAINIFAGIVHQKLKRTNVTWKLIEKIYKYLICERFHRYKIYLALDSNSIQHSNLITSSDSY